MKSKKSVLEKYCLLQFGLLVLSRLSYVAYLVPVRIHYRSCYYMAWLLTFLFPSIKKEIYRVIHTCFPNYTEDEMRIFALRHVRNIIFQITILSTIHHYSAEEIDTCLDGFEFERAVKRYGYKIGIITSGHMNAHLFVVAIARILYRNGLRMCGTYQFYTGWPFRWYYHLMMKKLYADFHTSINVGRDKERSTLLKQHIKAGKQIIGLYGDYRSRRSESDIVYRVGDGYLCSNYGLKYCLDNYDNPERKKVLVPYMLYDDEERKFKIYCDIYDLDYVRKNYYTQILPALITTFRDHWQLWFMGNTLLYDPDLENITKLYGYRNPN